MPNLAKSHSYHHRGGEVPLLGATIPEHSSQRIPPFEKGGSGGI
jgi:hypothetical protein